MGEQVFTLIEGGELYAPQRRSRQDVLLAGGRVARIGSIDQQALSATGVGCLGVYTTTKTLPGLLAKVRAFNEEGITAFMYSGGYNVPPVTLTGSVRTDMLLVAEVIGAGEIAIADARSTAPSLPELDRLVRDAYAGGLLTRK